MRLPGIPNRSNSLNSAYLNRETPLFPVKKTVTFCRNKGGATPRTPKIKPRCGGAFRYQKKYVLTL